MASHYQLRLRTRGRLRFVWSVEGQLDVEIVDAQFWLNLQSAYDLRKTEREAGKDIIRTVRPRAAAE